MQIFNLSSNCTVQCLSTPSVKGVSISWQLESRSQVGTTFEVSFHFFRILSSFKIQSTANRNLPHLLLYLIWIFFSFFFLILCIRKYTEKNSDFSKFQSIMGQVIWCHVFFDIFYILKIFDRLLFFFFICIYIFFSFGVNRILIILDSSGISDYWMHSIR